MSSYNDPPEGGFDPNTPVLRPETPRLEHLLDYATTNALLRANKVLPARVVALVSDQVVDIQILPKTLYAAADEPVDKPVIPGVPVVMPKGALWSIRYPIAVGDLGYALIVDRNAEAFFEGDGSATYSPADTRLHDLADAVFVPGLVPTAQQTTEGKDNTDMVFTNRGFQVRMQQNGKVALLNSRNELLDLFDQMIANQMALMDVLSQQALTLTLSGPQPFVASTIAAIAQVKTQAQAIRDGLETLLVGGD
jgi:Phage protein Gp138 N-terminal domain